jgi:phage baseplate assembly protein W|tara:strand:+ start:2791 stop:3264 length:474 start_codon:yes stop_codon:yes gene_type:complete
MSILRYKSPLQPKWPLRLDDTFGPYDPILDASASLRQDFIFLLQTIPGEWPMNPDLGVGLATYLFETPGSAKLSEIKTNIQNQLRKYLPNISLVDATFESTDDQKDSHVSILKIKYVITDLGLNDQLEFAFDTILSKFFVRGLSDFVGTSSKLGGLS